MSIKIIDADVQWYKDACNYPQPLVLVSSMPNYEELIYTESNGLYYASEGPIASFYYYTAPGNGFAGHVFKLKMNDGSVRELRGPWSSNEAAIEQEFGIQLIHVSLTDKPGVMEKGYTFYASSILLDVFVREAMPILRQKYPDIELIKVGHFWTVGLYRPDAAVPGYYKITNSAPEQIISEEELRKQKVEQMSTILREASGEQAQIITHFVK